VTRDDAVTDFFALIRSGELDRVRFLLGADPSLASAKNQAGVSAILTSVYSGRKEIRDLLLASGAILELQDAVAVGDLARVEEIVGKNPHAAKSFSADGFPIVALACAFGHFSVAKFLAEQGADVNASATNGTGYNALTGAVAGGHEEIAGWLLRSGASANYRYGAGHTPLLTAAANGRLDLVKLLLAHGADASLRTDDRKSALDLARERKHAALAEFLENR